MSHYVKFTYQRARADITPFNALVELNAYRRKLLELRLVGLDSNGIGFGNLRDCELWERSRRGIRRFGVRTKGIISLHRKRFS